MPCSLRKTVMPETYSQIQKQIETLQKQAERLRQQEVGGVIARIKDAIAHYGLTAAQLGLGSKGTAARKTATASTAKYRDGLGNSWSGRGPRPQWLRDAVSAGRSIGELLSGGKSPSARANGARTAKKRQTKVLYRGQAGHSWSGMGPRPRWLKEALDGGKTLEELSACTLCGRMSAAGM